MSSNKTDGGQQDPVEEEISWNLYEGKLRAKKALAAVQPIRRMCWGSPNGNPCPNEALPDSDFCSDACADSYPVTDEELEPHDAGIPVASPEF